MQMNFHRKLPIPQEVKKEFPLTENMAKIKEARDEAIRAVFEGRSDKFILVIGPCSADREDAVIEYLYRLRRLEERVRERIFILPRAQNYRRRLQGHAASAGSGSQAGYVQGHRCHPGSAPFCSA